jgi:hypothetical protein
VQIALFNKISIPENVLIFHGKYVNNYPAKYIRLDEETAKEGAIVNMELNAKIMTPVKIKFPYLNYIGIENNMHCYNYTYVSVIAKPYDIPYDFSWYPLIKIEKKIRNGIELNIIREDRYPGNLHYRAALQLHCQKYVKNKVVALVSFYDQDLRLQAELYSALYSKKFVYLFSMIDSDCWPNFIKENNLSASVIYVFIPNCTEANIIPAIKKYMKIHDINADLLYGVFQLEKFSIFANNILHSIPASMLLNPIRLWILYEKHNYLADAFIQSYAKLGMPIEVLQIHICSVPALCDHYCIKDIKDYYGIIKKHGRADDYVINYNNSIKQMNILKKSLELLKIVGK